MSREFDNVAENYNALLNEAVKFTGYDAPSLARAKLKKLRALNAPLGDATIDFLDYGCGLGNLCREFNDYFPRGRYHGVDASEKMIQEARSKNAGRGTFHGIESTGWRQNRYQVIFASGVFHHIPCDQHLGILTQLRNLLTEEGKLIVWEHNPLNPVTRKIVRDCPFDKDAELIHPGRMKKLFRRIHLSSVKIVFTTFFPRALDFLSPLESFLGWVPLGGQYITVGEKPRETGAGPSPKS